MSLLPLVERGLRVAARRGSTHWLRLGAAGVAFGCTVAGLVLFRAFGAGRDGQALFHFFAWLAWVFAQFEGLRQTADCVSSERREGTLGLLFLTPLRSLDIILGKLAPAALHTVYAVLAMVPVLGLALLMGGVTGGEVARVAVALLVTVALTLAAGVLASVFVEDATQAWLGGAVLAGLFAVVSGSLLNRAFAVAWAANSQPFWVLLGTALLLAAAATGLAAYNLRAATLDTGAPSAPYAEPYDPPAPGLAPMPAPVETGGNGFGAAIAARPRDPAEADWLAENPALWLARRQDHGGAVLLGFTGGFLLAMGSLTALHGDKGVVLFVATLLGSFGAAALLVGWEACRRMADLRRTGVMELIAATPLGHAQVVQGFKLGLRRQFRPAVLTLLAVQALIPLGFLFGGDVQTLLAWLGALALANAWLIGELVALGTAGLYLGFRHGSPAVAFGRLLLGTLVVPCMVLPLAGAICLWPVGLMVLMGKPLFIWIWANQRLEKDFARLATESLDAPR
jgi:ABC-type transport system involved in cytochrome c biogenesis permease component